MPIRFRGPVRPRKLKSPDPIKMPVVRNDKVPRIKSDVLYYKENGSLPTTGGGQTSGFGHSDWQAGDGLITHDYYTGLDWLKMPATVGKSIPDVEALLATTYSGWRIANNHEVVSFFNNILVHADPEFTNLGDPTPGAPAVNNGVTVVVATALREWIGSPDGSVAYGWWYEYASDQPSVTDGIGGGGVWSTTSLYDWRYDASEQRAATGVFLVRNGTKPTYVDQTPPFPRGNFNPSNFYTDSVTGLKWLRLNYTIAVTIDEATSDPKYAGLRLATPEEVEELLFNFFGRNYPIAGGSSSGRLSGEVRQKWQDTFGITGVSRGLGESYGAWVDENGIIRLTGTLDLNDIYHGYDTGSDTSTARGQDGVFLVQE